jgi:hypothetical protein
MPDPIWILVASAGAALAAGVLLLCGWRAAGRAGADLGGAVGVGAAFFLGARLVGARPQFPPREDQDRWLLILLPASVVVEVAASLIPMRWLAWVLRLVVAAGAAPTLLYRSTYLADLSGPGSREWTTAQVGLILGGLAAALATGWALLDRLALRAAGHVVPLALALAGAGAGVTVMLSGYASGGQLGLPLAGGLAGAAVASFFLAGTPGVRGATGVGVVALFALLVVGRFFGTLTTINAVLLFAAPLLAWLAELPFLHRVGPRLRGIAGVSLAGLPVILALVLAARQFSADSARKATPGSPEPSLQDYLDFGK